MVAALIGAGIATVCGVIAWLVPLVRDAKRERRFNKIIDQLCEYSPDDDGERRTN
jgi:hypothetical protein